MRCLSCGEEIGLGKRAFVIPFEEYAEDAYLFAHHDCMPDLEGKEGILDGYFVEGSEPVFVPYQVVETLKRAGDTEG